MLGALPNPSNQAWGSSSVVCLGLHGGLDLERLRCRRFVAVEVLSSSSTRCVSGSNIA